MGQWKVAGGPLKCMDCGSTNTVRDPDGACRHELQCGDCGRGWVRLTSGNTWDCSCERRMMRDGGTDKSLYDGRP